MSGNSYADPELGVNYSSGLLGLRGSPVGLLQQAEADIYPTERWTELTP